MCDLSRVQLQRVFKNTALALSAVVEQLNLLAGLDATPFIPRGAEAGTAGTIDIAKLVAILAKVLVLVIGRDTTSLGRKARVENLRAEFQDGVYMVTSHGETNLQVIQLPVYKARKAPFISNDIKDCSTAVRDAALSAKSNNWHEPPGIDEMPGVVIPTWAKIGAYMTRVVGWSTVKFTRNWSYLVNREGVRSNVRAGMTPPLSFRVSAGLPGGDAVSSEMEVRTRTATIGRQIPGTAGKRRRRKWGRT